MPLKLVRTQLLLDYNTLKIAKQRLKNYKTKTSLAAYIRDLMSKDVQTEATDKASKYQKLLAAKGFIHSAGDGSEAQNHNDIYSI
ncbi:MAG: hypothetical protein WCK98_07505 [bacterium]